MSTSKDYFNFLDHLENSPDFCYRYITEQGINKKHPTYEQCLKTISKDAGYSVQTAEKIIQGRFVLGEPAISKDPKFSYFYAKDTIKGRFELGEPAIASDPRYAYEYAQFVLKGRFELGELTIAQNEHYATEYAYRIIKGKLPEEMHNVMLAKRIK
jgi:hypothetical protein